MLRYLLFAGRNHYPSGGACDLLGAYNTIPEAMERLRIENSLRPDSYDKLDWANILDTNLMTTHMVDIILYKLEERCVS